MPSYGPSAWGAEETRHFYELTPDRILDAVEACGLRCTGRSMALNSMENRVYQVEIEVDGPVSNPSDCFRVVKFYRPGRWSEEQIKEEHLFLSDLVEDEITAVAPLPLDDGETLARLPHANIHYAVFPRVGGRLVDELADDSIEQLGRLIARVHNVGARRKANARIRLDPATYGIENLRYLVDSGLIPDSVRERYRDTVEGVCNVTEPWFAAATYQRIHGDCHVGNVLWRDSTAFLVDFDDMVVGPCAQDVWLLAGGQDTFGRQQRELFVSGYEELRDFDRATLRLIEPLRALRFVHFSAWIARRWEDPSFQRVFGDFGSERYWFEQVSSLQEQLGLIQEIAWG